MTAQDLQNKLILRKATDLENCKELAQKYIELCLEKIDQHFSRQFVTSYFLSFEIKNLNITEKHLEIGESWTIPFLTSIRGYSNFIPFSEDVKDLSNEIYGDPTFTLIPFVKEIEHLGFDVYVNQDNSTLVPFFRL